MKNGILDVLMYIYERFIVTEDLLEKSEPELMEDLIAAGFNPSAISKALNWLEELLKHEESQASLFIKKQNPLAFRVYATEEDYKISIEAKQMLHSLEKSGVLTEENRELVIDRLMALEYSLIESEHVKNVILMILFEQLRTNTLLPAMENLETQLH